MRKKFVTFDASGFKPPAWFIDMMDRIAANPKSHPCWDGSKPDEAQRLKEIAGGIKLFLRQLPDGVEIGTGELAKCLHPDKWEDPGFRKFFIARIGQCRYYGMLSSFFNSTPDTRWKTPHTFYKYHNGKGKTDAP